MGARLVLVLHAHLPWVIDQGLEERWLYEALGECYLPLLELLERLAREGVEAALALSLSPPLCAMLADERGRTRFAQHLDAIDALNDSQARSHADLAEATAHHRARIAAARATWERCGGDPVGAFAELAARTRLELFTTSVSHAYLPGLAPVEGAIAAQLALGRRAFAARSGSEPAGMWLPECAYDAAVGEALASVGARWTVVDAHALELARPRPPPRSPLCAADGVAYFARDRGACDRVWAREGGYPGAPRYREFYRDVGFELGPSELGALAGGMTGLKYWAIDGGCYRPGGAEALAREQARTFVTERRGADGVTTIAFDAELFGHWWHEGVRFLEELLRAVAACDDLALVTPSEVLDAADRLPRGEPAASSWGRGGYGQIWVGPQSARLWRRIHDAHRRVARLWREPLAADRAHARRLATVELCLLEASDWAFQLELGDHTGCAARRVEQHLVATQSWCAKAARDGARQDEAPRPSYLAELDDAALAAAFGQADAF